MTVTMTLHKHDFSKHYLLVIQTLFKEQREMRFY